MATEAAAPPTDTPAWPTAPELDPKYDEELLGKYPTIVPKTGTPAEDEKGYAGNLNDMQKAQLFQLRSMLESEGYNDRLDTLTMLRFLRARKFDVNLSKQMFVEFEEWRKKVLLDALVPTWDYTERSEMVQYYPQFYHKTDKDGRPVYIEKLGFIDLNAMHKITTDQRMLDNLAVEYEKCGGSRLPAASRKNNQLVETFCTIMDMKGVSLTKAGQVYQYVNKASVISQNYYPERLGKLYIINAPWGFSGVWSIVKGWLDPVTVKKIHILGSGYQKELLAQIPAENLPEEFGGSCKCVADPNETDPAKRDHPCWFSDAGPWKEEGEILKKELADAEAAGQQFDERRLPWFERPSEVEKAKAALKGTDKDPALRNPGGETAGAAGQQAATVAA